MNTKQINIAVPSKLYSKIEDYVEEYGYRNAQDLFLDLVRQRVVYRLDMMPIREDFSKKVLSMDKKDFLGKEKSDNSYEELKRKVNL